MRRGVVGVMIGGFLAATLVALVSFNLTKSRVLVVHSAARNTGWTQRVDEGIRNELKRNRLPVTVHWHYLALENATQEDDRQEAATVARRAITQFRPDVVLTVDDEAQAYVGRHYVAQGEPRIVFAAIDREPADHGYAGAANVSGVLERLPLQAMHEAITTVRKGQPTRVAVIGAADETGRGQLQQVQAFNWGPHRLVASYSLPDFEAWQDAITRLQGQADVLVVLSLGGLPTSASNPRPASMAAVAGWIEANARPLPIGIGTSFVENGGGLAIAPSPRVMGEMAMRMSLDWIRATSRGQPAAPAMASSDHYRVALRESALRAREVVMPSVYIEAARLDQNYFP